MKNKLLFVFTTIILMLVNIYSANAMIVFSPSDIYDNGEDYDEVIEKDGVSISELFIYSQFSDYSDECYEAFGTFDFTVSSSKGKIAMIGISYSPYDFSQEYEYSNNNQGDFNNETEKHYQKKTVSVNPNWIEASVGSIENGSYSVSNGTEEYENQVFDISVWRGSSTSINFSFNNHLVYIRAIYVYFEGDELPEKAPFSILFEEIYDEYDSNCINSLNWFYGYGDFIGGYNSGCDFNQYSSEINKGSLSSNKSYDYICIHSSFKEYHPQNVSYMFAGVGCDVYGLSNLDLSEVIDFSYMFAYSTIDVYDDLHIEEGKNLSYMFSRYARESLDISSWNFSPNTIVTGMFSDSSIQFLTAGPSINNAQDDIFNGLGTDSNPCKLDIIGNVNLGQNPGNNVFYWKGGYFKVSVGTFAALSDDGKTLTFCCGAKPQNQTNTFDFNTADTNPAWYSQRANITRVVFDPSFAEFRPTSTYGWFRGMENLEEIEGLEYLNTSETTLMSYMFYGCSKLKSIDVSHFDTKNVAKMGYMFQNCTSLESIDISNFDYYANTSCYRMFNGCTNLKEVNFGEWKNNANNQYGYMFAGCSSLEKLDLSQLVLPSDAKTTSMLNGCKALRLLTISSSMNVLDKAACSGVGTANNPCDITAPDDFDYGVDTSVEPFRWKSGYFRLVSKLLAEASDVKYGNVYDLKISLRNGSHVYNGYQFNVHLPAGFDLTQKPRTGYEYTLSNRYTNTPTIRITPQDDGSYQVLAYAMDDVTITGTEGLIITLPLNVEEGLSEGNYSGTITDITFNNPDNTSAYLQDVAFDIFVPAFGMGDVNHDRSINITDVMMTVNHVVGQTPAGFHVEDADVNGDGVVNISDIMAVVNFVVNAPTANAPALSRESMTDAVTLTKTAQGYAVSLRNNEPYTALQMDIQQPNDAPLNVRLSDNRSDGHSMVCSDLGNGHHRIAIYSLNGHALKGNDGILLQLQTSTKHDALPEIYDVQLTNRLFESVTLSDISFPTDITNVNMDEDTDVPTYNTQGIRVSKNQRGVVIRKSDGTTWKEVVK